MPIQYNIQFFTPSSLLSGTPHFHSCVSPLAAPAAAVAAALSIHAVLSYCEKYFSLSTLTG
jgi:hypothetical protein